MEGNKLYNPTKNQRVIMGFWQGPKEVVCLAMPKQYSSLRSFRGSLAQAAKRLGVPVSIRVIKGHVYLIKEQMP